MEITPLLLIDSLRNSDKYIKTIYTEGGCYKFHLFLKHLWPEAVPVINATKNHIGSLISGVAYDINGKINWPYRILGDDEISIVERWDFAKHNMLQIGECPICEEPIVV